MVYMEKVLQGKGDTHFDFLALSAADTDQDTRDGLMKGFDRLLQKHPSNSQLIFGKALLLQQDDEPQAALKLLEQNPPEEGEIAPLLLRARLLQSLNRGKEALPLLQKSIKKYPDAKRLRLTYARMLVEQDRMEDAKVEFASLVQQYPDDDELRYSLALVCLEAKAWEEAKGYLEDLIARESHVDSAHLNLGRIAEEQDDPQGALIESRCMRWSRRALLDFAMAQLHLVVPTLPQRMGSAGSSESPADTLRRRILIEFAQQLDEFTNSSFDLDVVAPRPIDRNAGGINA